MSTQNIDNIAKLLKKGLISNLQRHNDTKLLSINRMCHAQSKEEAKMMEIRKKIGKNGEREREKIMLKLRTRNKNLMILF